MNRLVTLLLFPLSTLAWAQEKIPLQPDDIARLGIVFAPAQPGSSGSGARFPGTIINSPEGVSTLTAPHAGVIEAWLVTPGDPVRAGQPVAILRSQDVLGLQQEWMTAAAAEESARVELAKFERLQADGIVSAQRVAVARRAHDHARFTLQAAAAPLHRVGFSPERLDVLRAGGKDLGRYRVLALADGVIVRRIGVTGDFVETNTTIARLRSDGSDWVSVQAPARLGASLSIGQILKTVGGRHEAVLRQKDHGIDDRSQTIGLLAEFTGPTDYLPGQIVSVELPAPENGVLVPGAAVVHSGDETWVFVRTAGGIEMRQLTLQPLGADYLASSGLRPGDELAVRGAAVLKGIKAGLGQSE